MSKELLNEVEETTEAVTGEKPEKPELPKDENGNPIFPTDFKKPEGENGERPEPPKDENGNPIFPPHFNHHGPKPEDLKEDNNQEKPTVDENVVEV